MIITETITMSNQRRYIPPKIMFSFLFNLYYESVRKAKDTIYDSYSDRLISKYHNTGQTAYHIFKTIMISQLLMDFVEWKPYVKSVDIYQVNRFLHKKLNLEWYENHFPSSSYRKNRVCKDAEMSILFFLHQRGMYFEKTIHIPKSIYKLTNLFLYGEFMLQKLFDNDFRTGKMKIFSNLSFEEKAIKRIRSTYRPYYSYTDSSNYERINFDIQEYNSTESTWTARSNAQFANEVYVTVDSVTDPIIRHNQYGNLIQVNTSGDNTIWTTAV